MLSPIQPSESRVPSSYQLISEESSSHQESQISEDGNGRYQYRYESQSSSYRVFLSSSTAEADTYTDINSNSTLSINQAEAVEAVDDQSELLDGAQNILSFMESRIKTELEQGATVETIADLLDQGLAGFKQGFSEAENILQSDGKLNDTVSDEIGVLYQQVIDGIEELGQEYLSTQGGLTSNDNLATIPSAPGSSSQDANGVNPSQLTLQQPGNIHLTFLTEQAAYSNSVGYYLIDENGLLNDASILWENGNETEQGDTVTLENMPAGEVGFFIIPDGYSHYQSIIDEASQGNGVLRFEDSEGNISSSNDDGATLVYYSEGSEVEPAGERTELSNVYHASYANLNADGYSHARSGASADGDGLTIGFEDLKGDGADWDLQDFVFDVKFDTPSTTQVDLSEPVANSASTVVSQVSNSQSISSASGGSVIQVFSSTSQTLTTQGALLDDQFNLIGGRG